MSINTPNCVSSDAQLTLQSIETLTAALTSHSKLFELGGDHTKNNCPGVCSASTL